MITNGAWTSWTQKTGADGSGDSTYAAAVNFSARVQLGDVTSSQRYGLGSVIKEATTVMYVLKRSVPAGVTIGAGDLLTSNVDGSATISQRVEYVRNREKRGGIAHFEVFLRNA